MIPIDKAYQNLLSKILDEGKEKGDRTGTGTISIFSHTLEMDMSKGFPLITTKKMFTKGIIHELLWFLNGDTNIKYLVDNGVNIWTPDAFREYYKQSNSFKGDWPDDIDSFKERIKSNDKFAEKWGELGPVYGHQWRGGKPVKRPTDYDKNFVPIKFKYERDNDQIQNAIDLLNNNPDSRRIIVSAWNVSEINQMTLPPCHWAFELYTEELTWEERRDLLSEDQARGRVEANRMYPPDFGDISPFTEPMIHMWLDSRDIPTRRLSLKWHQRSVDTFLGLPFNIASYGLLLEMFAQQTNMVPGMLIGDLTNVHIYSNHIEQCTEQQLRTPKTLPRLELTKAKDMFSYTYDDIKIVNYSSHSSIKGDISV